MAANLCGPSTEMEEMANLNEPVDPRFTLFQKVRGNKVDKDFQHPPEASTYLCTHTHIKHTIKSLHEFLSKHTKKDTYYGAGEEVQWGGGLPVSMTTSIQMLSII